MNEIGMTFCTTRFTKIRRQRPGSWIRLSRQLDCSVTRHQTATKPA
jgi:hypothetical protein